MGVGRGEWSKVWGNKHPAYFGDHCGLANFTMSTQFPCALHSSLSLIYLFIC